MLSLCSHSDLADSLDHLKGFLQAAVSDVQILDVHIKKLRMDMVVLRGTCNP